MKEETLGDVITTENLRRIIANPFYAINIDETMCMPHEPMVTEEEWIKAAENYIKENGAKVFLENLLENLKGNYV